MPVARTARKMIRFRPAELRVLEAVVRRQGVPFSEWARASLLRLAALVLDQPAPEPNGRHTQGENRD